jgi:endoglucanase
MRNESLDFLRRLVDTPGPSGYEQPVQRVFREYVGSVADEVRTDVMGNVIAARNPGGSPRIMLAGHADEIGFQVRYISDEGMLYFGGIGGHDAVVAAGQRVVVHTADGPVLGVLGRKAVHLLEADERDKAPKLKDMWIDIGAADKKEAESLVAVGDCVTYAASFDVLRGSMAVARSFDDKMGAFIVAETLRILTGKSLHAAVFAVATVQEEVGLRGAIPGAFGVAPDVGIGVDVGHSTDYPGADKKAAGDVKLGGGPMIARGSHINPRVFELLVSAARELDIPFVIEAIPGGTGTDTDAIQMSRAGVATGVVSVPLRYMHTPNEVISLDDIERAARLLAAFCERVTAEEDWIPR